MGESSPTLDAASLPEGSSGVSGDATTPASDAAALAEWQLTWSDEFNGASGTKPDSSKWSYDTGGGGWGNMQLQNYTSSPNNVSMDGSGNLAIIALSDSGGYTSGRINTEGKFSQTYGRFEARIKLPYGAGMWPAFWMLGTNVNSVGWPTCGEMDIMENKGVEPSIEHSSLHGPGYSGTMPLTATYTLPGGAKFSDDFHVFAMEWETDVIRFYVDDQLFETRTPADVPNGDRWVYDHPAFILLNLAVGGMFGGNPNGSTVFPQTMLVDYVRVYARPQDM